jgi:hypothetical protein
MEIAESHQLASKPSIEVSIDAAGPIGIRPRFSLIRAEPRQLGADQARRERAAGDVLLSAVSEVVRSIPFRLAEDHAKQAERLEDLFSSAAEEAKREKDKRPNSRTRSGARERAFLGPNAVRVDALQGVRAAALHTAGGEAAGSTPSVTQLASRS